MTAYIVAQIAGGIAAAWVLLPAFGGPVANLGATLLDKRHEHIKSAPAEGDRLTVGEELAAIRHDSGMAELEHEIHSHGL